MARSPIGQVCTYSSDEVNALASIASEILRLTDDIDSILNLITEKTRQFLGSDESHIDLIDHTTNEIYVKSHSGLTSEEFIKQRGPANEGLTAWVFREKKPVICTDYASDPRRSGVFVAGVSKEGLRQLIGVPLFVNGEVTGVLFAGNRSADVPFSSRHVALASAFANLASVALQNARLFCQQQHMLAKLKVLNEKLSESNRLLRQVGAIHEQFILLELGGGGVGAIAETLAALTRNPVLVEDRHGELIAASAHARQLGNLDSLSVLTLARSYPQVETQLEQLTKEKKHIWVPGIVGDSCIKRRLVTPIVVKNEILGYVSVLETGRKLEGLDVVATQYAALVLALDITKQRAVFEAEQRAKGDLFSALLSGDYASEDQILRRASYLGYNLSKPRRVMVIKLDEAIYNNRAMLSDLEEGNAVMDRLLHAVNRSLSRVSPQSIAARQGDEIILLAACDDSDDEFSPNSTTGKIALTVKQTLKQVAPELPVSIGIGCICLKLKDYQKSYDEARKALDIAMWMGKKDEIVPLSAFGLYWTLFEGNSYDRLRKFSQSVLKPIEQYDAKRNASLLKTLVAFFDCNCSFKSTARRLFIHENTLRQRLERIENLVKLSLSNSEDRFVLQFALKIWELTDQK